MMQSVNILDRKRISEDFEISQSATNIESRRMSSDLERRVSDLERKHQSATNIKRKRFSSESEKLQRSATTINRKRIFPDSGKRISSDLEKLQLQPTKNKRNIRVKTTTLCILILAEEWDNPEDPFSLIAKSMAEMLATHCQPKMEVFCTVLNQTEQSSGIVKILHPRLLEGHVEQKLRAFFGAYYLPDLVGHRVAIIIGLSPLTADAVFTIRNGHFCDAKVVILNNCIPSEAHVWLSEMLVPGKRDMIQWAEQADIVVSAGIKVFDFYKSLLPAEKPHLKYFPFLSCYPCKIDHLQPQSPRTPPMHAFSCQSGLNVQGPVLEAIGRLTADETLKHWNIYIKAALQEKAEQSTFPCCTFKAIPDSEEDVHSSLCESSIYIDSEEVNPMWGRGLDAINHCVPFCTIEESHLAKTLVYFEELVDQYFVECDDDPTSWERKIKKCLDPQKLYKVVNFRQRLLPKATVENDTLVTTICDHVTFSIHVSSPSTPEDKIYDFSEIVTGALAREPSFRMQIEDVTDGVILAVKRPGSIRLAMVASDEQSLDELFERSQTPEVNTNISKVILQQTCAQEWLERNGVGVEDISFTAHIDEEDYSQYRRSLGVKESNTSIIDLSQRTLKKTGTIDIKTAADDTTDDYSIPSMTVDDDNNLFVCDYSNMCVKCINSGKVKWISKRLTSHPYGIGILQTGEIVVTLEMDVSLVLLDRKDGRELRRVRHGIKSDRPALSVHKDTIVIFGYNITVFHMSDYNLVKLHVISKRQGKPALERPHYVHMTPDLKILVTDWTAHTLQEFNIDGQHQFTYGSDKPGSGQEQLNWPHSLCTDPTSNIMVADCYNNRVVMLSPGGRYVKDLLTENDGLSSRPRALTLSKQGILYVSNNSSEVQAFQ